MQPFPSHRHGSLFGQAKTKTTPDRNSIAVSRVVILVPTLFLVTGLFLERGWIYLPYFVTQWMINYTGGFVRRGFVGELFWLLGQATHASPMGFIACARFALAATLAFASASLVYRNRATLGWVGALAVLACPSLAFYLWAQPGAMDTLFILITVLHLHLAKEDLNRYWIRSLVLFNVVGTMLALTHEALFLMCIPVNAAILFRKFPSHRFGRSLAVFALPAFTALVAGYFHGTARQAHIIYDHWHAIGFNQPFEIGFAQIGFTLSQDVKNMWGGFHYALIPLWALNVMVCVAAVAWVGFKITRGSRQAKKDLMAFVIVPFFCSLPLYFVGSDWDRWFSITWSTGVLAFLSLHPWSASLKVNFKMAAIICAAVVGSLFVRPYTPFVPAHRFIAGPIVRFTEFVTGQMPS